MIRPLKLDRVKAGQSAEELFIERYDRMLSWALQLTGHDRELAEDLLHDLFIQFTLNVIDPQTIGNLDGYLYIMLKNLHLAHQRRAGRNRLVQLPVVEYDSAEIGLGAIDLRDQLAAQDDLRRVCQYACARKETAKIASVLILRFFHGYYPEEITRVARSPRAAVDKWLKLARGEARASFEEKGKLAFIVRTEMPGEPPEISNNEHKQTPEDFLETLRDTIFRSRRGECFGLKELEFLYNGGAQSAINCPQFAHIVSCRDCLDAVNGLLGLPRLAERSATETLVRDSRKKGGDGEGKGGGSGKGGGTGGGVTDKILNKLRRKAKDTFVHKPQELCVAVNGYALGSHLVTAERSELNLVVERAEQISFVEVYSEQKIRLLLHNIEELPPAGPGERTALVKLSDDRLLELTLRFTSPSPTIQVVYLDPSFHAVEELWDEEIEVAVNTNQDSDGGRVKKEAKAEGRPTTSPLLSLNLDGDETPASETVLTTFLFSLLKSLANLWKGISNFGFWLKPETVAVVLTSVILVAGIAYLNWNNSPTTLPTASAPEILRQATASEQALAARQDLVLRRTISLEERNLGNGEVRSRQRIEIWQSAAKGVTARRLFDDQGRLVAGEFTTANGASTVYRKRKLSGARKNAAEEPQTVVSNQLLAINNPDAVWQLSPSAKDFAALVGQTDDVQLEDKDNRYFVSYERRDHTAPGLIKADLVLSKSDLHPMEQTLLVRVSQGAPKGPNAADDELIEYRFVETAFEQRSPGTVPPSVFEPDLELLVPATTIVTQKTEKEALENPSTPSLTTTSDPATKPAAIATADLEVEVLRLLNQAGADIDDQTNVTRTSDGKLQVTGLVDSKERKNEVLRALEPVAKNPALLIKVETYSEAAARQKQTGGGSTTVERIEVNKSRIGVFDDVSRHLGNTDEEAVRRFSAQILNRSRQIMSTAGTLKKLAGRFSNDDLASMSPEARSKWLSVIRAHARTCEQETRKLRQELQAVFFQGASGNSGGGDIAIDTDAELQQAAVRLFNEAAANDRVIRSAFTISAGGPADSSIKTQQFLRALTAAENLAASLQRVK